MRPSLTGRTIARLTLASALALGSAVTLVTNAIADEPSLRWSGIYMGIDAGAAWGDAKIRLFTPGGVFPLFLPGDDTAIIDNGSAHFDARAATLGLHIGYNYQIGSIVLGVEADWGRLGLNGTTTGTAPTPFAGNQTTTTSFSASTLLTMRARLGLAQGSSLLYLTGGAAYARARLGQTISFDAVPTADTFTVSDGLWGWTVGGGGEFGLDDVWSFRLEYLYVDFRTLNRTSMPTSPYGPPDSVPFDHSLDLDAHLVRVGLSRRF